MKIVPFAPLDPALYREIVRRALAEDLGWGDVTTEATVAAAAAAHGRDPGEVRRASSPGSTSPPRRSGSSIRRSTVTQRVTTTATACAPGDDRRRVSAARRRALLTAERTALNFLQRLSGIATLTRRFVDAAGGRITILDTRKTTPTLRALEKYAVRAGGGTNHRVGLDDGILIKDNHIRLAGGVAEAVRRMKAARSGDADRGRGAEPRAGRRGARGRRGHHPARQPVDRGHPRGRAAHRRAAPRSEISGGVTLERMPELAATGADYVSVGALTHSAPAVDLSFELEPDA